MLSSVLLRSLKCQRKILLLAFTLSLLPALLGCPAKSVTPETIREAGESIADRPYAPWVTALGEDLVAGRLDAFEKTQCSTYAKTLQVAGAVLLLTEGHCPKSLEDIRHLVVYQPVSKENRPLEIIEISNANELADPGIIGVRFQDDLVTVYQKSADENASRPIKEHTLSFSELTARLGHAWGEKRPLGIDDPRAAQHAATISLDYTLYLYARIKGRLPTSSDEMLNFFGVGFSDSFTAIGNQPDLGKSATGDALYLSLGVNPDSQLVRWGIRLTGSPGEEQPWAYSYRQFEFDQVKTIVLPTPVAKSPMVTATPITELTVLRWRGPSQNKVAGQPLDGPAPSLGKSP